MSKLYITLLMASCFLTGCTAAPSDSSEEGENLYIVCKDPRPQICTREYRPVCGIRVQDSKTYGNACTACGDPKVIKYSVGACSPTNPVTK